jgi:peptidoglycan/xylan/chitin deacetylase (PgdA/CDA1 family)
MLTIVMYRYVRDLKTSRYPRIKGIDLRQFRGQLDYLRYRNTVISMEELIYALDGSPADLPPDAALLTFDDGFVDHYAQVLPLLDERGWQGSFFVPTLPVLEGKVLDVHKLHFTLAAVPEAGVLVEAIARFIDDLRPEHGLSDWEDYWSRCGQPNRFDSAEVVFVKRMLQRELPEPVRQEICDALFRRYVTTDETAFASDLYMSLDQLRIMQRLGMHIGAHGHDHRRLDSLSFEEQESQVRSSINLLAAVEADTDTWTIAYPYGAHDEMLRAMVRKCGGRIGLTTEVNRADLWHHDPLALPRLDTSDLPKQHTTSRQTVITARMD